MKLVVKTVEKVVFELTLDEIKEKGFDFFWDKIRRLYKAEEYDINLIKNLEDNEKLVFIELLYKKE